MTGFFSELDFPESVTGSFSLIFDDSVVESEHGGFQYFWTPVLEFSMTQGSFGDHTYDLSNISALIRYLDGEFYDIHIDSAVAYDADGFTGAGSSISSFGMTFRGNSSLPDRFTLGMQGIQGAQVADVTNGTLWQSFTSDAQPMLQFVPLDSFKSLQMMNETSHVQEIRNDHARKDESWYQDAMLIIAPFEDTSVTTQAGILSISPDPAGKIECAVTTLFREAVNLNEFDFIRISFSEDPGANPLQNLIIYLRPSDASEEYYYDIQDHLVEYNPGDSHGPEHLVDIIPLTRNTSTLALNDEYQIDIAIHRSLIDDAGARALPTSTQAVSFYFYTEGLESDAAIQIDYIALGKITNTPTPDAYVYSGEGTIHIRTSSVIDAQYEVAIDRSNDLFEWTPIFDWGNSGGIIGEGDTFADEPIFYRMLVFPKITGDTD